jgi:C4-dicarboxylate-specific signal transduction histidine kinase
VLRVACSVEDKIELLEQALQRQEVELLRSRRMATLGVMASGLAHEINQPLQIILAVAQNCIRDIQQNVIDTKGILADLEHIATTTKRIDKIVNHLHFLAREHKPKLEAVDVNTIIENSFIMFHQQLKSRGIKIERHFSPDLLPVKADMIQLEQVFINLINNARDALEGRANKTITISTQEQNGHIQVRFQDNGAGIAPENLPKIFDAFFTTKQEQGGIGLGLYITQDIIQSFGGAITVDSRVNEGTTFLIKLPITRKEDEE